MKGKQIALLVVAALVLTALFVQTALAGSQTIQGITFNGPNNYAQCIDAYSSDTVTITGLTGHKPPASVQGTLKVYFITGGGAGRDLIQTYNVNSDKNVSIKVQYPPVSQWPPNGNPNTHEIHVDVAIKVFVNGTFVDTFDGNPNLGWDVYCTSSIMTGTPTMTRTGVPRIGTATPTGTILVQQGGTPTKTPTSRPTRDRSTDVPPTVSAAAETPTPPAPVVAPTTGATADASMTALGMIMLFGLGLLGAGWALKRAAR